MAGNIGIELDSDTVVLTPRRDFEWKFQNLDSAGDPTDFPAGDLFIELQTGGEHNSRQRVDLTGASGGTYTLALDAEESGPIDYYDLTENPVDQGIDITDALVAMPNIADGDVKVHPAQLYPVWKIAFELSLGANEVQHVQMTGATGGTFMLSFGLENSGILNFGDTPGVVQTALESMTGIGSGQVDVTDDGEDGYLIEFIGTLANTDVNPVIAWQWGLGFALTGPWFVQLIKQVTVVNGSAKMTEPLVNTLNSTINTFFDGFEDLLGVDIDFTVSDAANIELIATSRRSFVEADLITFSVEVTSNALEALFNGISTFLGMFDTINVDFYWNHTYEIEFIEGMGLQLQSTVVADGSLLTGSGTEAITVTVIEPGKHPLTVWDTSISTDTATMKVESEDSDLIANRTLWQLVWLPDGEAAGGEAVALGRVRIQGR